MRKILNLVVVALAVGASAMGATITWSGQVTSTSGFYTSLVPNGSVVTGSVVINEVSEDQDSSNGIGIYQVTNGLFSLVVQNLGSDILSTPTANIIVETYYGEIEQSLVVRAGFGNALLTLVLSGGNGGGGEFLTSDAFPQVLNWSNFTSGYGDITVASANIAPAAEGPIAEGDQLVYSLNEVNAVPEPATVAFMAAGLGLVAWKRRQSR
jgi:hypothetical protein